MLKARAERFQEALKGLEISFPRKLRWNHFGEAKLLWSLTALLGISIFIISSVCMYYTALPLIAFKYGKAAQGMVTDYYSHISDGSRNDTSRFILKVQYSNGDEPQNGIVNVSEETYETMALGSTMAIHYLPFFPNHPFLDSETKKPLIGFLLFLLLFGAGLIYGLMWLRKQRYLLTYGKVVKGSITGLQVRVNKSTQDVVSFGGEQEYCTLRISHYYYGATNLLGDEIIILRDPNNPNKYMAYDPSQCFWRPVETQGRHSKLIG